MTRIIFINRGYKSIIYVVVLMFLFFKTIAQESDSIVIYKKLKKVADKSKFATLIYNSVFVEPKPQEYPSKPVSHEEKIVNPYLKYENRVIRKIEVNVYDPFGHSVKDTTTTTQKINFFQKTGNTLHIASKRWVILNKLLFKEKDTLNPLYLSESERLIRQAGYVNDAHIFVSEIENSDEVNVFVIVQDKWTVTVPVVVTDINANIRFRNQNLFGLGHQFEQYAGYSKPDKMDYSGYYNLSNIDNTYVSSLLSYETNSDGTRFGIAFDRPFYSPLAEWAGGAAAYRSWKYYQYNDSVTGVTKHLNLNASSYDLWLGKNIKINSRRKIFNQSTNFIIGERFSLNTFDKRPSFTIDVGKTNQNSYTVIGNVGFAVQQYYQEKFIYRFGATEDVPQGLIVQFLYGMQESEFGGSKYYLGGEIARAKHYRLGYFSVNASYGMFFGNNMNNDITTHLKFNYFSDLFRMGKWYLREFINYSWVNGINKMAYENVNLTSEELYGFNSGSLSGSSKMVMNIETVAYAPNNLLGFRFAPALLCGLGMVGKEQSDFTQSKIYQSYALALMVRNENLLSSTFQISFGMYPYLPEGNKNIFVYNPITSFTIRVRTFSIGRPEFINY